MKKSSKFVLLFSVTYFVSYITRINFGAIISEMTTATGISRELLSLSVTGNFITYGVGQIISGICGDKISPKRIVSVGLTVTVLMNFAIPLCNGPYWMLFVWCINGFAQSFMWPPLVKLMTASLTEDEYKTGCQRVGWGGSFGKMAIYLIAPLLISFWGWKSVFVFTAICGVIMIFVWERFCQDVKPKSVEKQNYVSAKGNKSIIFNPVMICIMTAIILQGMLRDGVTTWVPTYISETYNLSNVIGILTGVVLPVFSILCFAISGLLYKKTFTNPIACGGIIFLAGALSAVILSLSTGKSAAVSVLSAALLTGCMDGVNLMLISMIPPFFKKYGNVATVSGMVNSCTYVGSAISTYGIAVFSQNYGWGFTVKLWILIALFGGLMCLCAARPWRKKMM